MLPNIASARRLTKVLIVNKSIEHVRQQREICLAADRDVQDLLAENHRLVAEVNAMRVQLGGPAASIVQAKPATEAMTRLADTKNHVFGSFTEGFGDKWVEKASKAKGKARVEVHGISSSDLPVTSTQHTAMDSPVTVQPAVELIPGIEKPSIMYQPPKTCLDPRFDTTTEASFPSFVNPFTSNDPYLPHQLLPNEPYIDGTTQAYPASWFHGLDTGVSLDQLQIENGDMLSCI